jgi:hypothetical protein
MHLTDTSDTLDTRVRERAYQIWLDEGCPDGCADRHWVQAERELEQDSIADAPEMFSQDNGRKARPRRAG